MREALILLLVLIAIAMTAPFNETSIATNATINHRDDLNEVYKSYETYDTYSHIFIKTGVWIMRCIFVTLIVYLVVKLILHLVDEYKQRRDGRDAGVRNPNGRVRAEYIPIVLIRGQRHRDGRAVDAETC